MCTNSHNKHRLKALKICMKKDGRQVTLSYGVTPQGLESKNVYFNDDMGLEEVKSNDDQDLQGPASKKSKLSTSPLPVKHEDDPIEKQHL